MNNKVYVASPLLRQLFAIQDSKRMQNKDLAALVGTSPDVISGLRRGQFKRAPVVYAEAIALALDYEIVLRRKDS